MSRLERSSTKLVAMLGLAAAAGCAMAAPPEFAAAVGADGPLLWYRFNEAPGATSIVNYGSLGAGYNGVAPNGVTLGAASAAGDTAARFSAPLQQYVESAAVAPASLTGNPTFTAETIVRVEGQASLWPPFLHWGGSTTGTSVYFSLRQNETNRFYAGFYNSGLRSVCKISTRSDAWYHVVWVRDSEGGTANSLSGSTLYVNGEPVSTTRDEFLQGAIVPSVTASTFRIQKATDLTRYFTGEIDEVALYGRALSPAEVREHFETLAFPLSLKFCPADFTGDCLVDDSDFVIFAASYAAFTDTRADLNGDGFTDDTDFVLFAQAYDQFTCE